MQRTHDVLGSVGLATTKFVAKLASGHCKPDGILVEEHFDVRILVRDRKRVLGQSWAPSVDIVEGSAENRTDLDLSLAGVHTAYYLLHSINLGPNFDEIEAEMARNFAESTSFVTSRENHGSWARPDNDCFTT